MGINVTVYTGRDNPIQVQLTRYDTTKRKLVPLDFSTTTRMVLIFNTLNPVVTFDSAATAGVIDWSAGNGVVLFNISQYALLVGEYAAQLIAYDPAHTNGLVLCDNSVGDKDLVFSVRDTTGTGDLPPPVVNYVEEAPKDGKPYGRQNGAWVDVSGSVAGVSSFNTRTGAVALLSADVTGALGYTPVQPSSLATVATTGAYADLSGKPTIPSTPADIGAATAAQGAKADTAVQQVAGYGLSSNDYTSAEKSKLAGIAAGATANQTDAYLLSRTNHTGTQLASTISDLTETTQDMISTFLVAGTNVTLTYDDVANTLTIASTGGGGGGAVSSVNGQTGAVVLTAADVSAAPATHVGAGGMAHANVVAGGAAGFMTGADKTKLDGIATGATANANTDTLSEGSTNLYYTDSRVRAALLTGLSVATNAAVAATDSILAAFGKLQAQLNGHFGSGGTAHANATTSTAGFLSSSDKAKLDGMTVGLTLTSKSVDYTLVLADANTGFLHPTADTTARTWTIPANASVSFPVGTAITFVNQNGAGSISIAITTDTMRLAGAGTTGTRTLAANGVATALKLSSNEWLITGSGLT